MATKNDEKILKLKERIEEKRSGLKPVPRFAPITNCNIRIDGDNYNLHAANEESLIYLLCHLKAIQTAAHDLGFMDDKPVICGYSVKDWMSDIEQKLAIMQYKVESAQLKTLETKLDAMLSDDKKTELELDAIANLLG